MKRAMDTKEASSSRDQALFVDIHRVLPEEEEEGGGVEEEGIVSNKLAEKRHHRPFKLKEAKSGVPHNHKSFSRQLSLETGFSILNREPRHQAAGNEGKAVLQRNGRSFGGFSPASRVVGAEERRKEFNIFRTKSTLGRQNSMFPVKATGPVDMQKPEAATVQKDAHEKKNVPAGRYFAALRGPELDQVKDSEDILLPKDEKWPFLLRFPIGCFGICLGLSSQSILWLALSTSRVTRFLHISPFINLALWLLAVTALITITIIYALKCVFYFEAVKREYFHPVRVNFFFAPWIVCMFLAMGAPPVLAPRALHPIFWIMFMGPVFCLELKIYGQWLSGGKRRLCKVANPSSHLSVVGNFVGAILASKVGWNEPAKFLWAVGFAHYLVVFVTLYQRLPTSEALPKELHPVYSMFIATPAAASIAWASIYGEFDGLCRTCYFIALFLYSSLVVRLNFFWGFRFSVSWWSYTFPMTTASLATIKYAEQVPCHLTKGLAVLLSFMSSTVVCVLFVSTLLHALYWRTLFPNDVAIAITTIRRNKSKDNKSGSKRAYDIRRWTKQSAISFGTTVADRNSMKEGSDREMLFGDKD